MTADEMKARILADADRIATLTAERDEALEALRWKPIGTAPNDVAIAVMYDDGETLRLIEADDNDYVWREWRPEESRMGMGARPMLWLDAKALIVSAVAAVDGLRAALAAPQGDSAGTEDTTDAR